MLQDRPRSRYIPLLILSAVAYSLLILGIIYIPPSAVVNFGLPNSYAPFTFIFFCAHFFLFSYIFLNSTRGYILSFLLTFAVLLRLNQVVFTTWVIIALLCLIALCFFLTQKVTSDQPETRRIRN